MNRKLLIIAVTLVIFVVNIPFASAVPQNLHAQSPLITINSMEVTVTDLQNQITDLQNQITDLQNQITDLQNQVTKNKIVTRSGVVDTSKPGPGIGIPQGFTIDECEILVTPTTLTCNDDYPFMGGVASGYQTIPGSPIYVTASALCRNSDGQTTISNGYATYLMICHS